MKMTVRRIALACLVVLVALAGAVVALNFRDEIAIPNEPEHFVANAAMVERGAYLARAGNCGACHTARGGGEFAGGLGIETPFGTVYSTNLTPDAATGIGEWNSAEFYRAMHNGRSRDGHLLYPAFPYPNFTQVTREDSDAIYAYVHTLEAVRQPNRANALRFPYNWQASLAVWRAMFFEPGTYQGDASKTAQWNRGGYLVRGLSHCNACHASRNLFGATSEGLELSGGLIPMQKWYAPALTSSQEAGVADWDRNHVVALLRDGVSPRGSVMGPMAEVVFRSTQFLNAADLEAMAVFLKELPQSTPPAESKFTRDPAVLRQGGKIYTQHCAQCHAEGGEGHPGSYPALAGNRAVTMSSTANLVRVVVSGGYLPCTAGNPRPYGMPPFGQTLADNDIAAVLTYIRASWGNSAAQVQPIDVLQFR
jgi:mono/diheme cytochrome c family protein